MTSRDDPERRQDQDVDLGVAEEPEEVLPEDGSPPLAGSKKLRAELAVEEEQQRARRAMTGHGEQDEERVA